MDALYRLLVDQIPKRDIIFRFFLESLIFTHFNTGPIPVCRSVSLLIEIPSIHVRMCSLSFKARQICDRQTDKFAGETVTQPMEVAALSGRAIFGTRRADWPVSVIFFTA